MHFFDSSSISFLYRIELNGILYAAEFSSLCTLENNSNCYNTELNFRVYIYI